MDSAKYTGTVRSTPSYSIAVANSNCLCNMDCRIITGIAAKVSQYSHFIKYSKAPGCTRNSRMNISAMEYPTITCRALLMVCMSGYWLTISDQMKQITIHARTIFNTTR